jgi:hypothetical protein
MKNFYLILILMLSVGCASGTNPYANNANIAGIIGGVGGAAAGALLGKDLSGIGKIAAIGGGAVAGMLVANYIGSWADKKDVQRNKNLIQKVLEENQDGETGSIQYSKSWKDPNTGQQRNGTVQQSATPLNTYQQHLGSDGRPVYPSGVNDNWNTGSQRSTNGGVQVGRDLYGRDWSQFGVRGHSGGSSGTYCRDMTIDISITGLTNIPQKTQWYKFCRDPQTGWKQVN